MTRSCHNLHNYLLSGSADRYIRSLLLQAFLLLGAIAFYSCEEGPTSLGSELLPSNDYVTISSTDTLSIWSYTLYDESVPSNDPTVALVGNIYDPYYGSTTAEFVSQLRLGSAWNRGLVTVDSVKMFLRLLTVTGGKTDQAQFLRLSEISDQLDPDTTYYTDSHVDTTNFGVTVQLPKLTPDTINSISVSLPVKFGEYLIRDTSMLIYSNTKPDFRSYFKGLYFRISHSDDPLLVSFSLATQVTSGGEYNNLYVLYLHDTAYVRSRYYFILDPVHPNACFNRIARDFSTADPDKEIQHINDMNYRDTLSYLQYLDGVYTRIVFPGLDSVKQKLAGSRFSINKARITLPVYFDNDRFTPETVPASLRLKYSDTSEVKHDVPDYEIDSNNAFFDGKLHKSDSTYYFNIPSFIQFYLEDKAGILKPELDIYQGLTGLRSVILKANASKTPVRFEMTYTKF